MCENDQTHQNRCFFIRCFYNQFVFSSFSCSCESSRHIFIHSRKLRKKWLLTSVAPKSKNFKGRFYLQYKMRLWTFSSHDTKLFFQYISNMTKITQTFFLYMKTLFLIDLLIKGMHTYQSNTNSMNKYLTTIALDK